MTEVLIDGEWVTAEGTRAHQLIDPTSRKLLALVQSAAHAQRQQAVAAARGVLGSWAQLPPGDRSQVVATIVDEIRQVAGALAERQAVESGQPLRECQDLVATAIRRLRSPLAQNRATPAVQVRTLPPHRLWPFWEYALKRMEAGSTLVCELPADRALAALAIAHCMQPLPRGVLNVVTTDSEPAVTSSGERAMEFVFVGQDADLDVAVPGAATLRLYNTGQRPGQSTRIHVEASLAYRFADRLHEYIAFLEAGDPSRPVTDLGPLQSQHSVQRAVEQIGNALKQGALLELGGRPYQPWGLTGYFLQPTLLVEGSGTERAPCESIHGPVVVVSPTNDIGAALRESIGLTRAPLRLTAFTGQVERVERSLRNASFATRKSQYKHLAERAWEDEQGCEPERACEPQRASAADWVAARMGTADVEFINGPQVDWFPYRNRSGLKL